MIESITFLENENGKLFIYPDKEVGTILGVQIYNYSLSLHKEYKEIFKVLKQTLKEEGIDKVYSICETEKEQKFNETFGLKWTGLYAVCEDSSVNKLMVWEI
jgi:hemerythrin-like domain-containing protein